MEQNDTDFFPIHPVGSLLIIRPIAALIWVVWPRHLALGGWTLHPWRWWTSWSGPHPRTEPSWLVKRWTKGSLVFRELLHGVGVIVMRWRGINRGPAVLWWRSWGWVANIRWQLAHDMRWWRSDRWGSCRHWGRRGLVVHHVWRSGGLGRMLHWVTDRRRWGRRRAKVLLWGHHVVSVCHYRWLARIVPRVVMRGLTRARSTGVRLP